MTKERMKELRKLIREITTERRILRDEQRIYRIELNELKEKSK